MIFNRNKPEQQLDLREEITGLLNPSQFLWQGVVHIWMGHDHILFLIVLLLPAVLRREDGKWFPVESLAKVGWNVLKIVTVFTAAHSITLTLAALEVVSIPSRLVESIIAASIVLVAVNNFSPKFAAGSVAIIFAFGLFHGLGFASVMGELPFRIANIKRVIVFFNVGVELGQIAIVVPTFLLLYSLRKFYWYRPVVLVGGSVLAGLVASLWFTERAFNLSLGLPF